MHATPSRLAQTANAEAENANAEAETANAEAETADAEALEDVADARARAWIETRPSFMSERSFPSTLFGVKHDGSRRTQSACR